MKREKVEYKKFCGNLEIFDMSSPWTYLPIPPDYVFDVRPGGWGSIPVDVLCGKTKWTTSMFPLKNGNYFIPFKKAVLKAENIKVGDRVCIKYELKK